MGGIELDLREAEFEDMEVTINASCWMGGIEIIVPGGSERPGARLRLHGRLLRHARPAPVDPDAPTVHVSGFAFMGGVDVKRKAPGSRRGASCSATGTVTTAIPGARSRAETLARGPACPAPTP